MTPIFFLAVYGIGIVLTLVRNPVFGLYTYLFTFYMAPSYTWWRNDVPDLRYLLVAGLIALATSLRLPNDPGRAKWHKTGIAQLLILFVAYHWLQVLWAIDRDLQIEGAILFSKHLVAFYLFYKHSSSLDQITRLALVHVVGCFWFGYQALGAGGGRLEDIGGAVAGANELGVHVTTGLLIGGILLLGITGARRLIVFGSLPLIANCLVLTVSRGAFLGLTAGGIAGYFSIPKHLKKRYLLCGVLGLILFGALAHKDLIERFSETYAALTGEGEEELDGSASMRVDIAKAGIAMGLDYPFGAGYRATAILSPEYMDASLLGASGVRTAHNTSAALFAERGFPGLILYYLMILVSLRAMWNISRAGTVSAEQHRMWMALAGTSLIAIWISGNFSNNVDLETQYWCLALLASVNELYKGALRNTQVVSSKSSQFARPLEANTN